MKNLIKYLFAIAVTGTFAFGFAGCSDDDSPHTPDNGVVSDVSQQKFKAAVTGKMWVIDEPSVWVTSDGVEHEWMFNPIVGNSPVSAYDFSTDGVCRTYCRMAGAPNAHQAEICYDSPYVYDETSGQFFLSTKLPEITKLHKGSIRVESLTEESLVLNTDFGWQVGFEYPESADADGTQSFMRSRYRVATAEEAAKLQTDYELISFD